MICTCNFTFISRAGACTAKTTVGENREDEEYAQPPRHACGEWTKIDIYLFVGLYL